MKKHIIAFVQYYRDKSRRRVRRRVLLFLLCIVAAIAFWLLTILGKNVRFEIEVPIVFTNVPQGQALSILSERNVSFTMEGTGWYFVRSKLSRLTDTLVLDLNKYYDKNEIDLSKNLNDLNNQFHNNLKIIDVFPAKLSYTFVKKSVKRVPIFANIKLGFRNQFDQSANIRLYPDSVTISGPEERIKNIVSWPTVPLVINDLNTDYKSTLKLKDVDNSNILLSFSNTTILIPVEKFTEKKLMLPIQLKGFIGDGVMTIFPKVCEVSFQVALSNYKSVKPQSFRLIASKDSLITDKFKITLVESPEYIKNVKIDPQTVDYLILK